MKNQSPITRFTGEHEFLSNFYPCPIEIFGHRFPTVEHAFQSQKTDDPKEQKAIREADTPALAKKLGRRAQISDDWEDVKEWVMKRCLEVKFSNPSMARNLLATGNRVLIEGNTWGDTYWGICNRRGENCLGVLLMAIRSQVRNDRVQVA